MTKKCLECRNNKNLQPIYYSTADFVISNIEPGMGRNLFLVLLTLFTETLFVMHRNHAFAWFRVKGFGFCMNFVHTNTSRNVTGEQWHLTFWIVIRCVCSGMVWSRAVRTGTALGGKCLIVPGGGDGIIILHVISVGIQHISVGIKCDIQKIRLSRWCDVHGHDFIIFCLKDFQGKLISDGLADAVCRC